MNYYPFHIGDYASATRHLTWDEDAAYRRLLDAYYVTEKPLPVEMRQVYRLVSASTEEQRIAVETVLAEFFELTAEGWRHKRCDEELAAMHEKKASAAKSANARWKHANAQKNDANAQKHDASASSAGCEGNAPNTNTNTNTKVVARRSAPPPRPEDVEDQTWADWCQLRKRKRADVSETALREARKEAGKAGLTLEAFLRVWCMRGSQGLQADWLTPQERRAYASPATPQPSSRDVYVPEPPRTPEQIERSREAARLARETLGRVA